MTCVCGINEQACMRDQQRAQCADPCQDRLAARLEEEGFHCAWCDALTMHEDGYAPDAAGGDLVCEGCNDRIERESRQLVRVVLGITVCPDCGDPTHATESDDTGRCARCRSCYYCDAEATRTGIERDHDDNARERKVCEECGASSDRAEILRAREIRRNDQPHV